MRADVSVDSLKPSRHIPRAVTRSFYFADVGIQPLRHFFYDGKAIVVTAVGEQAHQVPEEARLHGAGSNGSTDQDALVFEDKDVLCPADFVGVIETRSPFAQ